MKKSLPVLLRFTFLSFYFLLLFKSKMVLASESVSEMPVVGISELNFSLKAPSGWKVRQNYRGKTLVFEDPLATNIGDTLYNRNITVAVQSGGVPIDGLQTERVTHKLMEEYSKGVTDFQIIEARIIDYRTKGDAILVFSSFNIGTTPMRQMHIFTSGSDRNVLLSFTDLQEAFEVDGALNRAWVSMMSAELSGEAPNRYDGLLYSGSSLALIVTAAFFSKQLRRRQQSQSLRAEEFALFEDDVEEMDDEFQRVVIERTKIGGSGAEDWQIAETRYAGQIA